jgi:hypothetical protein
MGDRSPEAALSCPGKGTSATGQSPQGTDAVGLLFARFRGGAFIFARFLPILPIQVPDLSRFFANSRLLVPVRPGSQRRDQRPYKPLISAYLAD